MPPEGAIYFDNAATAGRRPDEVVQAVRHALCEVSANPGRSGHRLSLEAARLVERARSELAALMGVDDASHVFLLKNATEGLNIVLNGFVKEGSTVLAGAWEHNAVMRPLRWLENSREVKVEIIPAAEDGPLDLTRLKKRLARGGVALVAVLAASNVTGEVMPLAEVGEMASGYGAFFLIDAAQGAGVMDLDVDTCRADAVAVTGHKSLYGPPGTGALYLRNPGRVSPLIRGGTGSRSEEEHQPDFSPDRFEAGTPNTTGLAGLAAGVSYVRRKGIREIRERHTLLAAALISRLKAIDGVTLYGPEDPEKRLALVSFSVRGMDPAAVARGLDERGVYCRPGLHCAPRAHRTLGTLPAGTVRFSLSLYNTRDEIEAACRALKEVIAPG